MSAEILHFFSVIDAPNRIREIRMSLGWSIQRLADAVNQSKMNVSSIERGNVSLTLEKMDLFARALGVAPADLLPRTANPLALSPEEIELIKRLREADDDARDQFGKVADVMLPFHHKGADREAG